MAYDSKIRAFLEYPSTVNVLVHLPTSAATRKEGYFYAHALQFSVCAKGKTEEEAIINLLDDIVMRCRLAAEHGYHPVLMTAEYYIKSFHMGYDFPESPAITHACAKFVEDLQGIENGLSLPKEGKMEVHLHVSSICAQQNELQVFNIEKFASVA